MPLVVFALFVGGLVLFNRRKTSPKQAVQNALQVVSTLPTFYDPDRIPGQTVASAYPGQWVVVKRTGDKWDIVVHTDVESIAHQVFSNIRLSGDIYIAIYNPSGTLIQGIRMGDKYGIDRGQRS